MSYSEEFLWELDISYLAELILELKLRDNVEGLEKRDCIEILMGRY